MVHKGVQSSECMIKRLVGLQFRYFLKFSACSKISL
jgi:hypothetical protein